MPRPAAVAQNDAPAVTGNARVNKLLGQMTLAEKMSLIHDGREDPRDYQGQAGYVGGVPRLGIPGLRLADGPPRVLTRHLSKFQNHRANLFGRAGGEGLLELRQVHPGGNALGGQTSFVLGVGVNPTSTDLDRELRRFAWKVEAGAEFAMTQPVFDLDQLDRFLKRVEPFGIPIIAGLWPLMSLRNAEFLANEVPGVSVPPAVLDRMRVASAKGKEAGLAEGILIAREMLGAVRSRVRGVQVAAPLGRADVAVQVIKP